MSSLYSHELVATVALGQREGANEGLTYGIRVNAGSFDAAAGQQATGPLSAWWLNVAVRPNFAGILSATAKGALQPTTVTPYLDGNGVLIGEDYLDDQDNFLGGWRFWKTGPTLIYATPQDALATMGLVQRADFADASLIDDALAAEPTLSAQDLTTLRANIDIELLALQNSVGGAGTMRQLVGVGEGLAKVLL